LAEERNVQVYRQAYHEREREKKKLELIIAQSGCLMNDKEKRKTT
jgi:hypothetical protein